MCFDCKNLLFINSGNNRLFWAFVLTLFVSVTFLIGDEPMMPTNIL
ncbi:hypothetical protein PLEI_3660 [Photobacterium leiognathi lrivu.4.1]|uniref:Uncharacterized protein n=1 Tax=Photobacterium leiognathi lrivu.4.1 TaxID=1248232 RepID=V5F921_PHOLE|nr:hypothetical protein PLEI_3660 [Photobacterium leiognathi lrivu.4.1]